MKSRLINENSASVSLSDIIALGGNLSAEYHVNRLKQKNPYIYDGGYFRVAKSHEIKNAIYLTESDFNIINELENQKREIEEKISSIIKK